MLNFLIAASTDKGNRKPTNEDSLLVERLTTPFGKMVFAVLCDGMGGLALGELASASLVKAFSNWVNHVLPALSEEPLEDYVIRSHWESIITEVNQKLAQYGKDRGISLGTTLTAMLLTQNRYYIANVGDTRAYIINHTIAQVTKDQTLIAREVELGRMTPEQAEVDPRKSVLLQCVGASPDVRPDMFYGDMRANTVYMLCTDGFRHEITSEEIFDYMNPAVMSGTNEMKINIDYLIEQNKLRNEMDNISVISIKTM